MKWNAVSHHMKSCQLNAIQKIRNAFPHLTKPSEVKNLIGFWARGFGKYLSFISFMFLNPMHFLPQFWSKSYLSQYSNIILCIQFISWISQMMWTSGMFYGKLDKISNLIGFVSGYVLICPKSARLKSPLDLQYESLKRTAVKVDAYYEFHFVAYITQGVNSDCSLLLCATCLCITSCLAHITHYKTTS